MEKITLTFVGRYTTKKDGTPLVGKTGKPYTSLRIKCNEYGDSYLSGFDGAATRDWKEGDTVEIETEKKGEYLNFSVPKKEDIALTEVTELKNKVTALTLTLNRVVVALQEKGCLEKPKQYVPNTGVEYPPEQGPTAFDTPEEAAEDPLAGADPFEGMDIK